MLGFLSKKKDDYLLQIMLANQDRVTIGDSGVIRVNFDNEDVQRKLQADLDKLKELKELDEQIHRLKAL
ncbi:hypothetical protein A6E05_05685 [Aliivibrio sp. 1S165]|uniref:hypothetical protein n=1 Tax=unclassified Aliivibrio TaxID=2645654 RepID=UPI00080E5024|nr:MULTISPECIES: hypothetical protein [unclassified Aliivibrio]OCH13798.1 hypothetical protein A6E05_05685 [Aliivibrio sp. 1S165]OCH31561.1 hypothetical protein A6E06_02755 [Aliivibrio sp. 1S175]